jgi:hypothetical protein
MALLKTISPVSYSDLFASATSDGCILSGQYIYTLSRQANNMIFKIDKDTYEVVASATITVGGFGIGHNSLIMAGGYLWCGDADVTKSTLYKIDPADLTYVTKVDVFSKADYIGALTADDTYIYAAGTYSAGGTTYSAAQQGTTDNAASALYGSLREAQTFLTIGSIQLGRIRVKAYRVGTIGNLTLDVYASDENNEPTGEVLATKTYNASALTTETYGATIDFTLTTPITLSAATKYMFVLSLPDSTSDSNCIYIGYKNISNYSNGVRVYYDTSWHSTTHDLYFICYSATVIEEGWNLAKITIADLTVVNDVVDNAMHDYVHSLCQDGDYVYGSGGAYSIKITKADLSVEIQTGALAHEDIWQDATYFYTNRQYA